MVQQRQIVICDICGEERIMPLICGEKLPECWSKVRNIDVCPHCASVLKKDYAIAVKTGLIND